MRKKLNRMDLPRRLWRTLIFLLLPSTHFSFLTAPPPGGCHRWMQSGGAAGRDMSGLACPPLRHRMALTCCGPAGDALEQRDRKTNTPRVQFHPVGWPLTWLSSLRPGGPWSCLSLHSPLAAYLFLSLLLRPPASSVSANILPVNSFPR